MNSQSLGAVVLLDDVLVVDDVLLDDDLSLLHVVHSVMSQNRRNNAMTNHSTGWRLRVGGGATGVAPAAFHARPSQ